jgi:translocation and assembly module TamB
MTEDRKQKTEDGRQRTEGEGRRPVRRRRSSVLRRLVKWSLLTCAGFLALILLLWAGLQTPWAKRQLAGLVADFTSKTGDYRVQIEGLDGLLPFSITVKQAAVSDGKGPWLKIEKFDFALAPADLISGLIHVKWLRMAHITVSRLPEPRKPSSTPENESVKTASFALPAIAVQEIRLDRIDLGEALTGKPMAFTLNSRLESEKETIRADAALKDLNRQEDAFDLKATYDLGNEYVTALATYHEAPEGLIAGLSGLKDLEGIKLTATAEGPVSNIKGHLDLHMGGYGDTALQYDIGNQKTIHLKLNGQITADARIIPPQAAQVMKSHTLDLALDASLSPDKEIRLNRLHIKNDPISISLEGSADLEKERMDIKARIEGFDATPFLEGTGISLDAPGPVHISAKGPFMAPEVDITTTLAGFEAQEAALKETTLNLQALFHKGFTGVKSASVSLGAQEMAVQQAPKLKGPLEVKIETQSPDFSTWRVNALNMTLPGITVDVKEAAMNLAEGSFSGNLSAQVDQIAAVMPVSTPPLDGRLSVSARVKGTGPEDLAAQLKVAVSQLSGLPPEIAPMAGSSVTLNADAEMKGERITLTSVDLKGSETDLTADGWVNLKESLFDVNYRVRLDHRGAGVSTPKTLLTGDVQSEGKISGKFDDFTAQVALNSKNLRMNDLEIQNLKARLKAKGLPMKPSGEIHLKASAMDQPLQLNSDFAWNGKALTVGGAEVQAPGVDMTASVDLTPKTENISGKVKGRITSLELVQALTGVAAEGKGTFQIEAGKSATGNTTFVRLNADFSDLKYQDYGAAVLKMHAQVDDIEKMQGRASLKATDIPLGSSRIETFDLNAKGALSGAEITLETKGVTQTESQAESSSPLFLTTKMAVRRTDQWQLQLKSLKAGYEGLNVSLPKPATLTYADDGRIVLDGLKLKTDKGLLEAHARLDKDKVDAKVSVAELPLSLLEPFVGQDLDGRAELDLALTGPLSDPGVSVNVHVKEYKIEGRDGTRPILLYAKLHSRRDGDRLLADLELSGLGKTPFEAKGSIPAHLSLKPFAFQMDNTGKLEGTLKGRFDLAVLQTLPAMADQTLRGLVDVDMGIGGSIEKWELNGGVTISKGRFENVEQGVLLDKIEGRLDAEDRILKLTRLTATDGGTGTIFLHGQADVDPPFQTDIALTMNGATLLRKEMVTVTAGGNLDVKGDKDRMDLTGEITLDRTEIAIPKRFPPDVTVIPVTTINDPAAAASEASASKQGGTRIQLNLGVNIPDKFFVRGRGLDVEFKGKLTVKGSAENPVVRGTLNVVRGTFLCLSRTFKVTNGTIAFDGAAPPVPFLNINTRVNAGDITAQVDVTGPADAFKLKLSSQPTLPQDEIMAQILFGQSVAKLNTFQALQLAYSVNELAGGYGPDIMGKTRSFLGLDRLDFSGGDENSKSKSDGSNDGTGPSVTLGKYVTDRVYVGVEQDLTDGKQDVIVDVNITPNFTVESKAGSRSGAGVGFNWNYDY